MTPPSAGPARSRPACSTIASALPAFPGQRRGRPLV